MTCFHDAYSHPPSPAVPRAPRFLPASYLLLDGLSPSPECRPPDPPLALQSAFSNATPPPPLFVSTPPEYSSFHSLQYLTLPPSNLYPRSALVCQQYKSLLYDGDFRFDNQRRFHFASLPSRTRLLLPLPLPSFHAHFCRHIHSRRHGDTIRCCPPRLLIITDQ